MDRTPCLGPLRGATRVLFGSCWTLGASADDLAEDQPELRRFFSKTSYPDLDYRHVIFIHLLPSLCGTAIPQTLLEFMSDINVPSEKTYATAETLEARLYTWEVLAVLERRGTNINNERFLLDFSRTLMESAVGQKHEMGYF